MISPGRQPQGAVEPIRGGLTPSVLLYAPQTQVGPNPDGGTVYATAGVPPQIVGAGGIAWDMTGGQRLSAQAIVPSAFREGTVEAMFRYTTHAARRTVAGINGNNAGTSSSNSHTFFIQTGGRLGAFQFDGSSIYSETAADQHYEGEIVHAIAVFRRNSIEIYSNGVLRKINSHNNPVVVTGTSFFVVGGNNTFGNCATDIYYAAFYHYAMSGDEALSRGNDPYGSLFRQTG